MMLYTDASLWLMGIDVITLVCNGPLLLLIANGPILWQLRDPNSSTVSWSHFAFWMIWNHNAAGLVLCSVMPGGMTQRHMPPFLSHIVENHHALASTLFLVVCLEIWNNLPKKPTNQTLKKLLPLIMAKSGFFFVRFISKPSLLKSGSGWKLVATWKFTACVQQRPLHFPRSCMIKELLSPVSHPPLIGNPTSD